MLRKLTILIAVALLLSMAGCGLLRQTKLDLVKEDTKNIETCRQAAEELRMTWLFKSGLIRNAIRTEQLSVETLDAMDSCDVLAAKEELTDYELGSFVGYLIRIVNSVSMQILQQYAPEILEALPLLI